MRVSGRGFPYFDPEYDTLSLRLNPPSVVIDNRSCPNATLVKVDSKNKHGILLEVVQVLTDLDLVISKAYISSDGGWFMDVFHVTDQLGNKVTNEDLIEYIQQSLGANQDSPSADSSTTEVQTCLGRRVSLRSNTEQTAIEVVGRDRPGLLSEVSGVLRDMNCNVVAAEVWTHNLRVACVVYVTEEITGGPIKDERKLIAVREKLSAVLQGDDKASKTVLPMDVLHTERRLHQMMSADCDFEHLELQQQDISRSRPVITVQNCAEKGYSVVSVRCKDRPKLLFDTVCTLTDMEYVVFHAAISSENSIASQEYFIRHLDGCTMNSEEEEQHVIKCLEAAIERRTGGGLRLELCTKDRVGLLSDVTCIFRENGLSVTRADVSTQGENAVNVFYVTDTSGKSVDMKVVEAIRKKIGQCILQVKEQPEESSPRIRQQQQQGKSRFSFGGFLYHLGLINSYSYS